MQETYFCCSLVYPVLYMYKFYQQGRRVLIISRPPYDLIFEVITEHESSSGVNKKFVILGQSSVFKHTETLVFIFILHNMFDYHP
jgi:hypothetical protein